MIRCSRCDAELSTWEVELAASFRVTPCWCAGMPSGVRPTLSNLAYAALCDPEIVRPIGVHDVSRHIEKAYGGDPSYSINAALSQGQRFCWAGRSLYGLARHGPIPVVRSIAEAAYVVLLAAGQVLYIDQVDFVLKQFNYRFNSDSLLNHLRGYVGNRWGLEFQYDYHNRVRINTGRDARHSFNEGRQVCRTHAEFDRLVLDRLAPKVGAILADRAARIDGIKGDDFDLAGDRIDFR